MPTYEIYITQLVYAETSMTVEAANKAEALVEAEFLDSSGGDWTIVENYSKPWVCSITCNGKCLPLDGDDDAEEVLQSDPCAFISVQ